MQVVDSEGYLKVKLVGGPVGPFVPYTGATANVDLGEYEIKAGQVEFDQTPTGTAGVATMRWNDQDGTADLGLKGGNVILQIGQEQVTRVVNKTGVNLLESNYQAVRVDGAQGNRLKVALAQADNDTNSADTLGLVTETINDNQEGFVTTSGLVRNIDTTGTLQGETWADGNVLYLSGSTAGRITNVKPSAPIHTVIMGYVVRAHATQGQIYVKVDNGYELDELHNVAITSPTNDQVLQYESATSLWKNKTLATGITIGTTAITSGTVGRVLFQGTGNVVSQSSNLFWDATNNRLGIGTSAPVFSMQNQFAFTGSATTRVGLYISDQNIALSGSRTFIAFGRYEDGSGGFTTGISNVFLGNNGFEQGLAFHTATGGVGALSSPSSSEVMRLTNTRNVLIGTTTDAGFRLDVNGTARVSGNLTVATGFEFWFNNGNVGLYRSANTLRLGGFGGIEFLASATTITSQTIRMKIFDTGNVGINTTTDAGFRLDVNGTARVSGNNMGGVFTVLNANTSVSISMASLLAASATGDTFFTVGRSLTNNNSALIGHSTVGGGNYAFLTVYGRPANDLCVNSNGQVGLGTNTPNASARLQIDTTTQGFLPPRMTTTQKNAIATPATGLQVYDTTLNQMSYYNGTTWTNI